MDFVKIASFQLDIFELLSRFVLFPNQDRIFLYKFTLHFCFSCITSAINDQYCTCDDRSLILIITLRIS